MAAFGRETVGWILSTGAHAAVVGAIIFGLPTLSRKPPEPPATISVDFVQIAEQTRQTEPVPQSEPVEQKQPPSLAAQAAPPPAENAEAVPTLEEAAEPDLRVEPKAKPEITARQKRLSQLTVRSKPKAPSRLDASRLAAVIDRSIKEEQQRQEAPDIAAEEQEAKETDRFAALRGAVATASLVDALSEKLSGCWSIPTGAKGIADFVVVIRIHLGPDGSLLRLPELVETGDLSDGFYRSFAESAQRAVRRCAPYDQAARYLRADQRFIDFTFRGKDFAP